MWIVRDIVFGTNVTRTPNGDKAVFDRNLADDEILKRLEELFGDTRDLRILSQRMENGQPFRHAVHAMCEDWSMEYDEWTNDKALAHILADLLREKTGVKFFAEESQLDDSQVALDPEGNDLVRKNESGMFSEYYVYIQPSYPWDSFVPMDMEVAEDMLRECVEMFMYPHVHRAEIYFGELKCWQED